MFIFITLISLMASECFDCHSTKPVKKPGHPELKLNHLKESQSCTFCHDEQDVTKIRLLTGDIAKKSVDLCFECHGIVARDYTLGIHGKRTGSWLNPTQVTCTECHNPHDPKFKEMEAFRSPKSPSLLIKKGKSHE